MHQCHLGAEVGEKHGELVVSRVFWQARKSQMHVANVESGSSAAEIDPTTPNMCPPFRRLSGSPLETVQNQVIIFFGFPVTALPSTASSCYLLHLLEL
jgi:hypothetical protein